MYGYRRTRDIAALVNKVETSLLIRRAVPGVIRLENVFRKHPAAEALDFSRFDFCGDRYPDALN